ncbi:hypothetical protein J2S43_000980 [Catenuloplanes nepalensis]|uniref:Uncharacterized protein n=1 Tax=Catenuloplanes nepalensis TaxID=587533 RepID=A0ABT9MMD5_9ACTN|nr:zinc ribbon domain-containing protein [Catenuloplanes nepalensis]MDP9792468.1 hypothetical protein [Catenuloplanes nepalensis]
MSPPCRQASPVPGGLDAEPAWHLGADQQAALAAAVDLLPTTLDRPPFSFLLNGLIVHARCGRPMQAGYHADRPVYSCATTACENAWISAVPLERAVTRRILRPTTGGALPSRHERRPWLHQRVRQIRVGDCWNRYAICYHAVSAAPQSMA